MSSSIITKMGINAKKAAIKLANIHGDRKNEALDLLKKDLKLLSSKLIKINKIDIENAHSKKLSSVMIDRLTLNEDKIENMIKSLDEIINLVSVAIGMYLFTCLIITLSPAIISSQFFHINLLSSLIKKG